jgi:hypothetical protein
MTDQSTKRVADDSSRDRTPDSQIQTASHDRVPASATLADKYPWAPLLAGFLGGCLPAIPAITPNLRSGAFVEWSMFAPPFFTGLLGVAMVWVYAERNRRKAFFIGVAAPGIMVSADRTFEAATEPLDAAKQKILAPGAASSAPLSWFHGLLPIAHAQQPVPERPSRSVRIEIEGAPEPVRIDAIRQSQQKQQVFYGQYMTDAILPPGVERLQVEIAGGGTASAELPLEPGPVVLRVTVEKSFLSNLLAGIGLTGFAASQQRLSVALEQTPAAAQPMQADAGAPASRCAAGELKCDGAQRMRCNDTATAFDAIEICGSAERCTPQACK